MATPPGPKARLPMHIPHGSLVAYKKYGCRCAECRRGEREYHARWTRRKQEQPLPPKIKHGTRYAYVTYGCRCGDCREAKKASDAQMYRRRHQNRDVG